MRARISGLSVGLLMSAAPATPRAQPAPAPDYAHATDLYKQATAELADGRYAEAARDFGAAYDITRDPVLFFKIGSANEQAGKCDVAVIYYRRYLREAHPSAEFVDLTGQRLHACGVAPEGSTTTSTGAGPATDGRAGTGSAVTAVTPGETSPAPAPTDHGGHDGAWLMVGGSLAFLTAGAVLAYSATSAEQDLRDLYVGVGGNPPVFDGKTAARYQELVDEGHRYEYLSWASFGVAAGCAVGAAILFVRGGHPEAERHAILPIVTPRGGGFAVRF